MARHFRGRAHEILKRIQRPFLGLSRFPYIAVVVVVVVALHIHTDTTVQCEPHNYPYIVIVPIRLMHKHTTTTTKTHPPTKNSHRNMKKCIAFSDCSVWNRCRKCIFASILFCKQLCQNVRDNNGVYNAPTSHALSLSLSLCTISLRVYLSLFLFLLRDRLFSLKLVLFPNSIGKTPMAHGIANTHYIYGEYATASNENGDKSNQGTLIFQLFVYIYCICVLSS